MADGAQPQYDDRGNVQAGYFRLRIDPINLQTATTCPKTALGNLSKDDNERWKEVGGALVDVVFKRNYAWGIDGTVTLQPGVTGTGPNAASVTLSLIMIKNPKKENCQIKIGGAMGGSSVEYESFLVPLGDGPVNFSDRIQVNLQSSYTSETDKTRVDAMWNGVLKPVVGAVFAPAATVVGAVSDQAQADIITAMNKNVIAEYPITFKADPGAGNRATKIFVKLDFVNLPPAGGEPDPSSGGVMLSLEYQASVFLRNAPFYKDITATPAEIISIVTRTAGGDKPIDSQLDAGHLNQLRYAATTVDTFQSGCATLRNDMGKLGFSAVDTSVYIWALASENTNSGVRSKVWDIPCIKASQGDLAKVGIKPPQPPVDPGRQATLVEMHKAMNNLATLMQLGRADPDLSDLMERFAPRITLIVDEHVRGVLQLTDLVTTGDKDTILKLVVTRFSRLGCYGPRQSSPDLQLPMRPDFPPALGATERASAAIALLGGREGVIAEPEVFSLKFGPVPAGGAAQVNTISIASRGADSGPVIKELTEGRRPVSCTETWMDPAFVK
jgi:hypothetical protein